mmetsp:Transcript_6309/g.17671  ORF Transcript_6309/g.17671 Transcript_6309/m.17671 type:complete len:590 (-) Transcript_6309:90-1859(-)
MGLCGSKGDVPEVDPASDMADALAWQRTEDFDGLYEVVNHLGEGSMGTVSIVKRKLDFNQSLKTTRSISAGSTGGNPAAEEPKAAAEGEGKGANGEERLFAMKTIHVGRVEKVDLDALKNEIELLRTLDHPNIIHMHEVLYSKRRIHMIMELCNGGYLSKSGCARFQEGRCCFIFKQILQGLAYLHAKGISHNDLKAENVVFVDDSLYSEVRLIDFGLSQRYTAGEYLKKVCGTYYTMAPEVYFSNSGYSLGADMWSAGVLLFIMLGKGQFPFLESSEQLGNAELVERWRCAKYVFDPNLWKEVSAPAKELVSRLLKRLPGTRATAQEALRFLEEQWEPVFPKNTRGLISSSKMKNIGEDLGRRPSDIAEPGRSAASLTPTSEASSIASPRHGGFRGSVKEEVLQSMRDYAGYGELKKHLLMVVAFNVDRSKLQGIARDFVRCDTAKNGTVSFAEFERALEAHAVNAEELKEIFGAVDRDNSGSIRYREFLAATVEAIEYSEDEALQDAFDRLDADNSGVISLANLKAILGSAYDDAAIESMLAEAGQDASQGIDYEGFLDVMRARFKRRMDTAAAADALPPIDVVGDA